MGVSKLSLLFGRGREKLKIGSRVKRNFSTVGFNGHILKEENVKIPLSIGFADHFQKIKFTIWYPLDLINNCPDIKTNVYYLEISKKNEFLRYV